MIALSCVGCGSGQTARKPTVPVQGKVFWKNEKSPAANALIVLHPVGDAKPESWPQGFPRGTVAADGTFKLMTYEANDGAPPGEYGVLIRWTKSATGKKRDESEEETDDEDRFDGAYSNAEAPRWQKTVKQENDPKDFVFILK